MERTRVEEIAKQAVQTMMGETQGSEAWKNATELLALTALALRADQIGDIRVASDPRYHRQPELNRPENLAVYVGDHKVNYLIDDPDIALLFGLAFKYIERSSTSRFVAFAARMLGIESPWASEISKPSTGG